MKILEVEEVQCAHTVLNQQLTYFFIGNVFSYLPHAIFSFGEKAMESSLDLKGEKLFCWNYQEILSLIILTLTRLQKKDTKKKLTLIWL